MRWGSPLTRAEAAKVIATAAGLSAGTVKPLPGLPEDVPQSHWASAFIVMGLETGLLSYQSRRAFGPQEPVTMAEYATMLARFYRRLGGRFEESARVLVLPEWACDELTGCAPAIAWLGLGSGGQIDLGFEVTRAQAAMLIHKTMEAFGLLYDLEGVVRGVSDAENSLVLEVAGRPIALRLQSDALMVDGSFVSGVSHVVQGKSASVIFGDRGTCAVLVLK